jgi:hypothetical protein
VRFFVGLHDPHLAAHVGLPCCISVNRLRRRRSSFVAGDWLLDSGAFTEVSTHGHYRHDVADYAAEIRRWAGNGRLLAAAAQDWMCEPFIVARTGLSVAEHQRLTVERYQALLNCDTAGVSIMPVLQGYEPSDYARHIDAYGQLLRPGAWVGVGSVCKRNASPWSVAGVLTAILAERPDLRLHGFGLKLSALVLGAVRDRLWSADSMAWSYSARKQGRDGNCWREALRFALEVDRRPVQMELAA